MRISDWSSDVCSSDLPPLFDEGHIGGDRRGGFGKVEAEIGELGGNVHDASSYQFGGGGRDIVGKPGENPVLGRGPIVDARMGVARGGDLVRDRRLADQVQAPHLGRLAGDRMMMRSEETTS